MAQRGQKPWSIIHFMTAFYSTLLLGFHIYTLADKYYSDTGNETLGKQKMRGKGFMMLAIERRTNWSCQQTSFDGAELHWIESNLIPLNWKQAEKESQRDMDGEWKEERTGEAD